MACWCKGECPHIAKPHELASQGRLPRATAGLRNALTYAPLCVEANLMLANILARNNHGLAALVHVERASHYDGQSLRVRMERAHVLRSIVRLDDAIKEFCAAMELAPQNPAVTAGLLGALEMAGYLDKAAELEAVARDKFPNNHEIRRLCALVADARGDAEAALAVIGPDGADSLPIESLDRGRYLEKLGRYGEAWACWMKGKADLAAKFGHRYDAAQFKENTRRLAEVAGGARPDFMRRADDATGFPFPVFVCGFPRSGTTLLETILSAHSRIVAGDELNGLGDVVETASAWLKVRTPYPACLLATSLGENQHVPNLMRDYYLREAQSRIGFKVALPGTRPSRRAPLYFTDKMPLNELHLPLIRLLFPTAPVLRLRRHPLDVMVSCMSHWLVHGGFFASSLEACATHYRLCDELMQEYQRSFVVADRRGFTPVSYERLVADQEGATRALLSEMLLELEPACLAHHKNPRRARTLSYRQVQAPINSNSVGRWRNFRDQLAPAVEILKPILERDGYDF